MSEMRQEMYDKSRKFEEEKQKILRDNREKLDEISKMYAGEKEEMDADTMVQIVELKKSLRET